MRIRNRVNVFCALAWTFGATVDLVRNQNPWFTAVQFTLAAMYGWQVMKMAAVGDWAEGEAARLIEEHKKKEDTDGTSN
jgi:hypothetical protein